MKSENNYKLGGRSGMGIERNIEFKSVRFGEGLKVNSEFIQLILQITNKLPIICYKVLIICLLFVTKML